MGALRVRANDPPAEVAGDAPSTELPDLADTAARARGGDLAAFRELIRLTTARLFRIAVYMVGDRDEADDLVQETFIRAWGRMDDLREPAAALAWLAGITRNAARDRLRSRHRRARLVESERDRIVDNPAGQRPDDNLAAAQLGAAVRRAVDDLADKYRMVLLLREVDGMSYEQVAQLLDLPVGTVESRVHRARAALGRRLERMRKRGELP
jgi:RNA polymerase sigma-70 factor (ECF subfamily)